MAIGNVVSTNNLEFWWDMSNPKSFKGKPTSNLCYHVNALHEPKDNISFHQYSTDATFNSNHPGRLVVNTPTGTRSTAVNGGVNGGNWQVTHHGYWKWDFERKKPVYYMNDEDGQWKANSFGLGQSFNDYGLSAGDTYSISWDSWTSRIDKAPNAGVYMRNTSGSNGFYAGQSNSQTTAKNTIPYKWQRVYAVFTVPTGMDMDHNLSIYCYGHYTGRGVVKMDNLQFELETPSYFVKDSKGFPASARSSTESLIDMSGKNTITVNSFNYQNDGTFNFSDQNHYASVSGTLGTLKGDITMMGWFNQGSRNGPHQTMVCTHINYRQGMKLMSAYHSQGAAFWIGNSDGTNSYLLNSGGTTLENTGVHHVAATRSSSTGAIKIYIDGVLANSGTSITGDVYTPSASYARVGLEYHSGGYGANATYYDTRVYSRELAASEISTIYNSTKSKYV